MCPFNRKLSKPLITGGGCGKFNGDTIDAQKETEYISSIPGVTGAGMIKIQTRTKLYLRLLNKPYVNGVTLREENLPLKCCQPLEILTSLKKGLHFSIQIIWGL